MDFPSPLRRLSQLQRLQLGAVARNAAMGPLGTVGRWRQVLRLAMIRCELGNLGQSELMQDFWIAIDVYTANITYRMGGLAHI